MDMNRELIINLRDIGHMLRVLYEGKGSQKRTLILLRELDGVTQRELTRRMGIQPGSVSEVLGKLEAAGLISRETSMRDRRTAQIYLTQPGRQKAEEAAWQRELRHQEMFSCLSREEKEQFLFLAEKLNNDWKVRYAHYGKNNSDRECIGGNYDAEKM